LELCRHDGPQLLTFTPGLHARKDQLINGTELALPQCFADNALGFGLDIDGLGVVPLFPDYRQIGLAVTFCKVTMSQGWLQPSKTSNYLNP
jgi:hypothetical protein